MSLETQNFEFGEFRLDTREKVLLRNDNPIAITPKAFLLLQTLVRNHGHIVERGQLMNAVWADSFVEDGNLTYTVNMLRKVLEDDKRQPVFIETVSRRGYRFVAPVKELTNGNNGRAAELRSEAANPSFEYPPPSRRLGLKWLIIPAGLSLVILGIYSLVGLLSSGRCGATPSAPILSAPYKSDRLSTDGGVHHAVVARDGKTVVYTTRTRGLQSVWLREVETSSNVEVVPASDDFYGGLALSPDGRFVYFARAPRDAIGQLDVFRVSIFGGIPSKIVSETQGWIDVSEDGQKLSFVRCYYRDDENCSLWIANAEDGTGETRLASRQKPIRIGANRIAPDGKTVAFAVGQSANQANEYSLMTVDIRTLAERQLTDETFFNIKGIAWLPDLSGALFTASKMPDTRYRIWNVSTPSGLTVPVTADSENYATLSLDAEGKTLVTTRVNQDFRLNLYETAHTARPPQILTDAFSLDFAKDGKMAFSSTASGNAEIWSIDVDLGLRKQLTNNEALDSAPVFAADGETVYFSSSRSGDAQVWRMKADGSMQTQVTSGEGGFPAFVSPDGRWVYYLSGRERSLRRVSAVDGADELILNANLSMLAFAPDGSRAAYAERIGEKRNLVVISVPEGQTLGRYTVADAKTRLVGLEWSSDGKDLAYILAEADLQRNSVWFMSIETSKPRRIADLGPGELAEQAGFTLSSDGKRFAVGMGGWKHDAVLFTGLR